MTNYEKMSNLENIRYSQFKSKENLKEFIMSEKERLLLLESKENFSRDNKMTFRYLSYDFNPTMDFLRKCNPINDELNGRYNNCSVQCFDIGKRKVIKKYVVLRSEYKIMTEKEVLKVVGTRI